MLRSIFTLAFIAFSFTACKKNKAEAAPDKQQQTYTINGHWRSLILTNRGPVFFSFNPQDSTYLRQHAGVMETGLFHTRAFNNPDSLEVQLKNHTIIIVKLSNQRINVTEGDSTREFKRHFFPG